MGAVALLRLSTGSLRCLRREARVAAPLSVLQLPERKTMEIGRQNRIQRILLLGVAFAVGFGWMPVYRREKLWEDARHPPLVAHPLPRLRDDINRRRFTVLEAIPPRHIVFLGDSRIAEGEWNAFLGCGDVANCGIMGDTADGVLERLPAALRMPGQLCVLEVGFNDLYYGASPEAVAAGMRELLARIAGQYHARVILCSILPMEAVAERQTPGFNVRVRKTNELLANLAGPQVQWIDLTSRFCKNGALDGKFTNDGAHLLGGAYRKWLGVLGPYLSAH